MGIYDWELEVDSPRGIRYKKKNSTHNEFVAIYLDSVWRVIKTDDLNEPENSFGKKFNSKKEAVTFLKEYIRKN